MRRISCASLLAALLLSITLPVSAAESTVAMIDRLSKAPLLAETDDNPAQGVFFGLFRETGMDNLVESAPGDLRFKPAAVTWFTRWPSAFPESTIRYLTKAGYFPQLTWEPWGAHDEAIPMADIAQGKWDDYIDDYARAAAKTGVPFMLRWGHEFNSNWYPWALDKNTAKDYVAAHRRIVDRFRAAGANQVQFVWCYNHVSVPTGGDAFDAWPGDDYVDWIGIDGYNWGSTRDWSRWTSFTDVFATAYEQAQRQAPSKPIIINEVASAEAGGDKAAWVREMFEALPRYPAIRAITWFDHNKETSWGIESTRESYLAFMQGLRAPYMRSSSSAFAKVVKKSPARVADKPRSSAPAAKPGPNPH